MILDLVVRMLYDLLNYLISSMFKVDVDAVAH